MKVTTRNALIAIVAIFAVLIVWAVIDHETAEKPAPEPKEDPYYTVTYLYRAWDGKDISFRAVDTGVTKTVRAFPITSWSLDRTEHRAEPMRMGWEQERYLFTFTFYGDPGTVIDTRSLLVQMDTGKYHSADMYLDGERVRIGGPPDTIVISKNGMVSASIGVLSDYSMTFAPHVDGWTIRGECTWRG